STTAAVWRRGATGGAVWRCASCADEMVPRRESGMTRYDLMHWSQRVRDQQAAARAAQPAPSGLSAPARRPAKPGASRPKPPRDEDAEQLLRLCREGRL